MEVSCIVWKDIQNADFQIDNSFQITKVIVVEKFEQDT